MPSHTRTQQPITLIELPSVGGLSAHQISGKACVWCAATLTNGAAIDLGQRTLHHVHAQWFPRACTLCIQAAPKNHAQMCEQCTDGAAQCDTGRALHRLARENRR